MTRLHNIMHCPQNLLYKEMRYYMTMLGVNIVPFRAIATLSFNAYYQGTLYDTLCTLLDLSQEDMDAIQIAFTTDINNNVQSTNIRSSLK